MGEESWIKFVKLSVSFLLDLDQWMKKRTLKQLCLHDELLNLEFKNLLL